MNVYSAAAAAIVLISAFNLIRLAIGRTIFDRALALSAIGTNTIALVILGGFIFARPDMFVDVAITFALLNFIGTVTIAKYLERKGDS